MTRDTLLRHKMTRKLANFQPTLGGRWGGGVIISNDPYFWDFLLICSCNFLLARERVQGKISMQSYFFHIILRSKWRILGLNSHQVLFSSPSTIQPHSSSFVLALFTLSPLSSPPPLPTLINISSFSSHFIFSFPLYSFLLPSSPFSVFLPLLSTFLTSSYFFRL